MDLSNFIPWVSFLAGLGGSLHCVGMCGGLVATCSNSSVGPYAYQFGRLIGYSLLGLFAGSLGSFFGIEFSSSGPGVYLSLISSLLMGGLLIFWGVKNYTGAHFSFPVPKSFRKLQSSLWQKAMGNLNGYKKGLSIGFLSIFLPCGLLYGAVISIASFQSPLIGSLSMMTFWLGTLPALATSGEIFKRIFIPLKEKLPRISSISLIVIGVATILWRVYILFNSSGAGESCH